MTHQQQPWKQNRTDTAEAFLEYVGKAGVALTALVGLGLVAGLLIVLVPGNEAVGTVVFGALLVAVTYAVDRAADRKRR